LLPNYFAPEQILGKPFKARSDVFSTAVVLYELLTKYPFPSEANLIPREIVHTVPEPLRKHDPEIPEELETLMARALEKDPEKRLERIDEFAAGLYLISQRMRGPVAVPAEVLDAIAQPPVDLPPPAFAPTFGAVKPAPVVTPASAVVLEATPVSAPIAAPPVATAPVTPNGSAGTKTPKRDSASKPARSKVPWLPYAVAAVLTFCISLTFLSRQNMRASQAKPQAAEAAQPQSAAPVATQLDNKIATLSPVAPAPAVAEAQPPSQPAAPKQSEEQVLLNQVKYFWASGKYALAMSKVDELITDYPDYMEGRIWKKKIRAAQEAEAAMK
jgi:serine/threonine-protein kinase